MINVLEKNGHHQSNGHKHSIPAMVEDPVRRTYKRLLAITFIFTSSLHVLVDLIFQVTLNTIKLVLNALKIAVLCAASPHSKE